jgi:formamidopyrimidine-DNA glycosylase
MPELPEVETTTRGLQKTIISLKISSVWTDLDTKDKRQIGAVANPEFFKYFKKNVVGKKIISVERRAKNILINLSSEQTILVHMKMTGHLLYGKYKFIKKENKWLANEKGPLQDPFNRFVHFVFSFSLPRHGEASGKQLAFSDVRKFGKITLLDTRTAHESKHLISLGIEPFDKNLNVNKFKERLLKKPNGKIKTVLMNQTIITGIGNIYSDEILWRANVHPERIVSEIKDVEFKTMFTAMRELLKKGIKFGGDSMSDYRNIYGLPGKFQLEHKAYRRTGEKCRKYGCKGTIIRKIVNGRSAHFCDTHQK